MCRTLFSKSNNKLLNTPCVESIRDIFTYLILSVGDSETIISFLSAKTTAHNRKNSVH